MRIAKQSKVEGASWPPGSWRTGAGLNNSVRLFAFLAPSFLLSGCHNVESEAVRQVTWSCPHLQPGQNLPRRWDDDGHVSHPYKIVTAVRLHFVDTPDQYIDLYDPGLCEALQAKGAAVLPLTLRLTRSPSGKLLAFEQVSLPEIDLSRSEQTRSTLYLAQDRDTIVAMDKKTRQAKENEFVDDEPIPSRRMSVEEFLK